MSSFSKDSLPLGYRFAPTEEELVTYLRSKNGDQSRSDLDLRDDIPEIDICKCEPWDVPGLIESRDLQWYFFCPQNRKYPNSNSHRFNRATEAGYWKATGQDRKIKSKSDPAVIGMMKILVFSPRGASSKSILTSWIIHEYRLPEPESGFVLCHLFKKPGERTSLSDVDDCMERNPQTVQNSILSPAPTMLPPDSDTGGISVEPVAPADQNFPVFDLQENVQPPDSDTVGISVEPVAPADKNFPVFDLQENVQPLPQASDMQTSGENYEPLPDEASNNPSNPEVTHVIGSVLSDVAADHESNETTLVLPEPVVPEFDDHGLDVFHINSPVLTDAELTKFADSLICEPGEYDASNAFSSPRKLDLENQSFVCPDSPHSDTVSVKEMQTGLVEEKDATISNNLSQETSFVEATTSSSHQVSAEMDNLDSAIIKIRTHKNSSDSDCLMEQQGSARKRLCLQKPVHKKSPLGTDPVSNTTNGDVVKSVVSEARDIVELQCGEEELKDVASHDEPASTGIQYSSSNILRRRAGCASKDEDLFKYCELDEVTTPSASHCTSTSIMILSALLFLIFIGLSWRLSS